MVDERVIVLIGPMGVGKTTVGKKLSQALGIPFRDTDQMVTKNHGDISRIFDEQGEAFFRSYEEVALRDALQTSGVVATGGGAVLSSANQNALAATTVIYLSTDGKHIKARLKSGRRPLLKNNLDSWQEIYDSRKPIYEKLADFTVDTSKLSLNSIVSQIKERLGDS